MEGLVKVEDLGERFALDAAGHALVEQASGRAYRVGDEVEVEVGAADPVRRRIDLLLVEAGKARVAASARPQGGGRGRREGGASRKGRQGSGGRPAEERTSRTPANGPRRDRRGGGRAGGGAKRKGSRGRPR